MSEVLELLTIEEECRLLCCCAEMEPVLTPGLRPFFREYQRVSQRVFVCRSDLHTMADLIRIHCSNHNIRLLKATRKLPGIQSCDAAKTPSPMSSMSSMSAMSPMSMLMCEIAPIAFMLDDRKQYDAYGEYGKYGDGMEHGLIPSIVDFGDLRLLLRTLFLGRIDVIESCFFRTQKSTLWLFSPAIEQVAIYGSAEDATALFDAASSHVAIDFNASSINIDAGNGSWRMHTVESNTLLQMISRDAQEAIDMFEWWRTKGLDFSWFRLFSEHVVTHACQPTIEHVIRVLPHIFTNDDVVTLMEEPSNYLHLDMEAVVQQFLGIDLTLSPPCMCAALKNRQPNFAKWLYSKGCDTSPAVFEAASRAGLYTLFPWLIEIQCPMPPSVLIPLAKRGELKQIQYLVFKGCRINEHVLQGALDGDQPRVVDWLKQRGCRIPASLNEF